MLNAGDANTGFVPSNIDQGLEGRQPGGLFLLQSLAILVGKINGYHHR
jgi:hypothetical protein